jgi:hypothetical protein
VLAILKRTREYFEEFTVKNISRTDISDADEIAKAAAQNTNLPQDVFFQVLNQASIKTKQEVLREVYIIQSEDWRAPIMAYLRGHYEPEDKVNEVRMKHITRNYKIINNQLYKQGICEPLLKCISTKKEKSYYQKYMKKFVQHIQGQEPWQEKHFDKDLLALSSK